METYLRSPIDVPLKNLYPDPNNPRLALEQVPGYEDAGKLFDEDTRAALIKQLESDHDVAELIKSVSGLGWMPIDNILVWKHPADPDKAVVVEGNRRLATLNLIRSTALPAQEKKLAGLVAKKSGVLQSQLEELQTSIARLKTVIEDSEVLRVVPVDARDADELADKLPSVLNVRHGQGAREWGNYAHDLNLLRRFDVLFQATHGAGRSLFWDADVVGQVALENSLTKTAVKRMLKAASWFTHFRVQFEDELPEGEQFTKSDYYLFELISRKPRIRTKLEIGEDDFALPDDAEQILFDWVFELPRSGDEDGNPNIFYRHENLMLWDQMHAYDEKHGTTFAARLDPSDWKNAPTMREVEAAFLSHKAKRKPHAVLDELISRMQSFTADELAVQGELFRAQLTQVENLAGKFLKMIDAAH